MMADLISPSPVAPCKNDDLTLFQFIQDMTRNVDTMQQDILTQILNRNAETEYLKSFGLNGATERQTFKSKIPTITYEDIHPLIQRIANGDSSPILCADPITQLLSSSGTSGGETKLIPLTKEEMDRRQLFLSLCMPIMKESMKGLYKGKSMCFYFAKSETKTPGGLPTRVALTSYLKSDNFKAQIEHLPKIYTSPIEAILCLDIFQSMYTQMLCGLYEREKVIRVEALYASTLVRALRFFQSNWQQLAHDIRTGSLNPKLVNPTIRKCMTRFVNSDPNLAGLITQECEKENWEGIIARIWPNAKYLDVIVTGTMAQYIPTLDYYSGGLPIVSMRYVSSEGYFGLNLNPMCNPSQVSYTIMPNMAYFEFLPQELESCKSTGHTSPLELVELADVEIGKEYEIVVTTFAGLYRYQVGDIVQVTGFYNSAPMFQVMGRKNVLLSVDMDMTYESELHEAMGVASRLLSEFSTGVLDYTSYADMSTIPGHYVVYLELLMKESVNLPSDEVLGKCCLAMEESLNSVYRECRVEDKSVGPLEIRIVKNGTFEELMNYAISRGASIDQYKVPRCVSSVPILKLLDERVVSTHFSPSLPHWAP